MIFASNALRSRLDCRELRIEPRHHTRDDEFLRASVSISSVFWMLFADYQDNLRRDVEIEASIWFRLARIR